MKTDEQEVINFLLTTEIIPLCLRIMESGSELSKTVRLLSSNSFPRIYIYILLWPILILYEGKSKTQKDECILQMFKPHVSLFQVATFILQKILLDDTGLAYICQTYERFSHVAMILVINYYSYCLEL